MKLKPGNTPPKGRTVNWETGGDIKDRTREGTTPGGRKYSAIQSVNKKGKAVGSSVYIKDGDKNYSRYSGEHRNNPCSKSKKPDKEYVVENGTPMGKIVKVKKGPTKPVGAKKK